MILQMTKKVFWEILRAAARWLPKDKDLVVFGAHSGEHYGDNSAALFEYMRDNNGEALRLVWLTDNRDVICSVQADGGEAWLKRSMRGIWLSLIAGCIVTSHSFEDVLLFCPQHGYPHELYLHHGIPLRKGIFREPSSPWEVSPVNSKKRFEAIETMVSTSDWAAEQQLANIPIDSRRVVITGFPRNDSLFDQDKLVDVKQRHHLEGFVILYAPTWRKWGKTDFFPFEDQDWEVLSAFLREHKMTIVLRPHHTDIRRGDCDGLVERIKPYQDVLRVLTAKEVSDASDLLAAADCLITDYSSILYDYLLLDRPVVFIPYDMKSYCERMGGFNCDYDKVTPGPRPKSLKEFLRVLERLAAGQDDFAEERGRLAALVHDFRDGWSCRRVTDLLMNQLRKKR